MNSSTPNVLFIINHDLGCHLECYGNKSIQTPNINALANDGVICDSHFATAPLCSPSRGSISTGRYPHSIGLHGLAHIGWDLGKEEKTMPAYFKDAGYSTYLFGFQHESNDPFRLGYEVALHKQTFCHEVVPKVNEFLRGYAYNGTGRKPFFAMVGFEETHRPYPEEWYEYDDPDKVEVPSYLPDDPLVRKDIAGLHGSVRKMDRYVGQILDHLEELKLKDNTIVVFTTDHGIAFPRAKSTLYDPGLKTALIIRWQKGFKGDRRISQLLSNIDVLPTLLDLAGIRKEDNIHGTSFAPLLKGESYTGETEIFAEKTFHDCYDPMRCVRTNKFKYIRNFIPGPSLVFPGDIVESLSRRALGLEPLAKPRAEEELYDLEKDPNERNNLITDPAYETIKTELRSKLQKWMESTKDPILEGPITMPGAYTMDKKSSI